MQSHDSSAPLVPSPTGLLFVSGYAASLFVNRGHLVVRSGSGLRAVETRFSRGSRQRIRRVVVFGKGGYATWEALAWLHGVGASFLCLSRPGEILALSGHSGPDQPALRRAQASATEDGTSLDIARYLIGAKLQGQASVLGEIQPADPRAAAVIERATARVQQAERLREVLAAEAKAASAYWKAWEAVEVRFARADKSRIPNHWLTVGERHSPLSASPRLAVTAAGAIFNFLYALAEFECRVALLAIGLDPGMGWFHRDAPSRDSAALDLIEAIRPEVDRYVLRLLGSRTFARKEFLERPNGQVRIATKLASLLTRSSLDAWEGVIAPAAEDVARLVAASAKSPVHARTRLTQADRRRGRLPAQNARHVPSACRLCGEILERADRLYCGACIPPMKQEKAEKLAASGKETLDRMRRSPSDPAHSAEARAKRSLTARKNATAQRDWDRTHGKVLDHRIYEGEVLPIIATMTVPALMNLTGLSQSFCWRVRAGSKRLHPRFWQRILVEHQHLG